MHFFDDLASRLISFTEHNLQILESQILKRFETRASTTAVKNLQMIALQRAITAVGTLSIFESYLQDSLKTVNGFKEVRRILKEAHQYDLEQEFSLYIHAVNVLKHGRGRSYDILVDKASTLPFTVKLPDQDCFQEGDIGEIVFLVKVDSEFLLNCAKIIDKVHNQIFDGYNFSAST